MKGRTVTNNARNTAKLWCLGCLLLIPAMGAPLDWTITLLPSANLSGPPGSTLQWNYSIKNLSDTDTLVLNTLDAGVFQHGTPLSIFDFPIVGSLDTVSGDLYQFTWDSSAPNGFVNSGTFALTADFYVGNPSTDDASFDTAAPDKSVDYSVTVADAARVPEPGTLALIFAILPILGWKARARLRMHDSPV